jgi:Arc/MetJ-type ribon-helix-helix transcriptional regulator
MKLSVSLPDDDVAFLDEFAEQTGIESRSAVVQRAIAMLRAADLARDYEAAFLEWHASDDSGLWDRATGDGMLDR